MKHYLILLMLLCCLLAGACSAPPAENAPFAEDTPPLSDTPMTEDTPTQAEQLQTADSPATTDWGIGLHVENVSSSGLTILCTQSGGAPTGELSAGSFYVLERKTDAGWEALEYTPQEYEIGWTSEAWLIPMNGDVTWDVDWTWLYGTLPDGTYRIGKELMDWRAPGDYDTQMAYAEFEVSALLICDGLPLAPEHMTDK